MREQVATGLVNKAVTLEAQDRMDEAIAAYDQLCWQVEATDAEKDKLRAFFGLQAPG